MRTVSSRISPCPLQADGTYKTGVFHEPSPRDATPSTGRPTGRIRLSGHSVMSVHQHGMGERLQANATCSRSTMIQGPGPKPEGIGMERWLLNLAHARIMIEGRIDDACCLRQENRPGNRLQQHPGSDPDCYGVTSRPQPRSFPKKRRPAKGGRRHCVLNEVLFGHLFQGNHRGTPITQINDCTRQLLAF